jgi:xylan 1,4-beta-xylosidase
LLTVVSALAVAGLFRLSNVMAESKHQSSFDVDIRVNASKSLGPLPEIWRFFGADEPNYATMKNGHKLLDELGKLGHKKVFFRTHNLLTSGDGTPALKWGSTNAYSEDTNGNPIYDWHILDGIFDQYMKSGVRPYVQIGFMPEALSTHPIPYRHHWTPTANYDEIYTGWTYPPKDYNKWSELVYQWTKHCVDRYGKREVETWYWETWNEPNIGYWHGTREEFWKLHDYAILGVRRALPNAKVGGADIAGGGRMFRDFIEHTLRGTNYSTGKVGGPLDFVSFHAKGSPTYIDGHVRMGISNQLKTIDENFKLVASFPELKQTPIVIGESDPEGCAACQGPTLGYRNGTMYSSYTAASFARKIELAQKYNVNLDGALTWAFTFENQPYFAGFRQLASQGIDLPVLNIFRMFSKMQGKQIEAHSSHAVGIDEIVNKGVRDAADVSTLASATRSQVSVMVWHYHDDDVIGPSANVNLTVEGLPFFGKTVRVTEYRIDDVHSNSYSVWKAMGSPQQPTSAQIIDLERAGQLASIKTDVSVPLNNRTVKIQTNLPRQGVSFFVVQN